MFRYSPYAPKQLLWLLLARDMAAYSAVEIGIDAGCGAMLNRPWFQSRRYVGIDIDAGRLAEGQARHPEAEVLEARLERVEEVFGDLVLCVQTFVNKQYAAEDTIAGVESLIRMVRPGGALIFNLAQRNLPWRDEIEARLREAFDDVHVFGYGRLAGRFLGPLAPPLAWLMLRWPALRGAGQPSKHYYRCRGRRGPVRY